MTSEVSGSAEEKIEAIWEKILASHDVAAPLLWLHCFFFQMGCGWFFVSAIFGEVDSNVFFWEVFVKTSLRGDATIYR